MPDPALRFAVGDPSGQSSNSWRVWLKRDGDVYIACRDNYRELKVSLHGRRWRVGVTAEGATATRHLRTPKADRAWMTWDRPEPVGGITMGYRVLFLPTELAITPALRPAQSWKDVEFVPAASEGCVTVATVTLNEPSHRMEVDGAIDQYHGFLTAPTGGEAQLTLHSEVFGDAFRKALANAYQEGRKRADAAGVGIPPGGRMFLVGAGGSDGSPFAAEVNFHRPDPDPLKLAES